MESLDGGHGHPHISVQASVQWAGVVDQPGAGEVAEESLSRPSEGVGPISSLGGKRPELTSSLLHLVVSLPVRVGVLAGPGSVDPVADRSPCGG